MRLEHASEDLCARPALAYLFLAMSRAFVLRSASQASVEVSPSPLPRLAAAPPPKLRVAKPLLEICERPRMRRYLPLSLLSTALVIVAPAALVALVVPRNGVLWIVVGSLAAVAVSVALAAAGAAVWKRQPRSRDVVFADLMLWCWLRRCWTERRLSQARDLFDSARKAGPEVNIELLVGLSRLLEARDSYVHGHSQRVARHAVRISRALGLSAVEIAKVRTAAMVHDVGKLYTPREILNNPRRLTDEEFEVVKRHAAAGAEMLAVVGDEEITSIVRHHHERIDGHGYPDGLAGAEIPLGARIIAVADTFDAITSNRAYRPAGAQKKALDTISEVAGSQLDVVAVAAFVHGYSARRSVAWFALAISAPQRVLQALSSGLAGNVGSIAPLLPAIGAAGLLAVSPGAYRLSGFDQSPSSSLALLQAPGLGGSAPASAEPAPDARAGGPAGGSAEGLHGGRAGTPHGSAPARSPGASGDVPGPGGEAGTGGGVVGGGGGSGGGANQPVPTTPAPGTNPPGSSSPVAPIVRPPTTSVPTVPPVSAPSVSTPSVSIPSITTPTVSTPSVTVGPVTVPSVTAPSVTVPEVKVPPITLPGVKLPHS
jgi:putative nucleotidyltransferase with HDIG domain